MSSHCTPESVSCGDPSSVPRTPLPFAPRTGVFSSSALWLLVSLVTPRALPAQGRDVLYSWHFLRRDPGQSSMCLWAVFQPPPPRRCPQGKRSCRGGQAPVHGMIPHHCPWPCFITAAATTLASAHCWDSSPVVSSHFKGCSCPGPSGPSVGSSPIACQCWRGLGS